MLDGGDKDTIRPEHYKAGAGDAIDYGHNHDINFCRGNVVKYVTRAGKKYPEKELQDLEKAQEYLAREIAFVKRKMCQKLGVPEETESEQITKMLFDLARKQN